MKAIEITPEVYDYVAAHGGAARDPLLRELRQETERMGSIREMQINEEQGSLMTLLVGAIGTVTALEIGTFTGYSSICIARGLAPGGRLLCLDSSEEWTAVARRYWEKAGMSDRIELRLAPARESLQRLDPGLSFDFVFIDADKTGYDEYYEMVLPRVRQGGLILFDNMLREGSVARPPLVNSNDVAIDALNGKLAQDTRVEAVLLSLADGVQVCRKR